VRIAVVLDTVTTGDDFATQFGVCTGTVADAEEAGRCFGGVELIEDAQRDLGVGAVVERQCDLAAIGGGERQAGQVGAE